MSFALSLPEGGIFLSSFIERHLWNVHDHKEQQENFFGHLLFSKGPRSIETSTTCSEIFISSNFFGFNWQIIISWLDVQKRVNIVAYIVKVLYS